MLRNSGAAAGPFSVPFAQVNASADEATPLLPQRAPAVPQATLWQQMCGCFQSAALCACFGAKCPDGPPNGILACLPAADRADLSSRKWLGYGKVRGGERAWNSLKQERPKRLALDIRDRCFDARADLTADFDLRQGIVSEQLYRLIERVEALCCPSSYANLVSGFYASPDPNTYVKARCMVTEVCQLEDALNNLLRGVVVRPTGGIVPPDWNHFALLSDGLEDSFKTWPADIRAERVRLSDPVLSRLRAFEEDLAAATQNRPLGGPANTPPPARVGRPWRFERTV